MQTVEITLHPVQGRFVDLEVMGHVQVDEAEEGEHLGAGVVLAAARRRPTRSNDTRCSSVTTSGAAVMIGMR